MRNDGTIVYPASSRSDSPIRSGEWPCPGRHLVIGTKHGRIALRNKALAVMASGALKMTQTKCEMLHDARNPLGKTGQLLVTGASCRRRDAVEITATGNLNEAIGRS